jgi:hypothetical protein
MRVRAIQAFGVLLIVVMVAAVAAAIANVESPKPQFSCDDLVKKGAALAVNRSWKSFNQTKPR